MLCGTLLCGRSYLTDRGVSKRGVMGKKEKAELAVIGVFVVIILVSLLARNPGAAEELLIRRPDTGERRQTLYLTTGSVQKAVSLKINEQNRTAEETERRFSETKTAILSCLNPSGEIPMRLIQSVELPAEIEKTGAYLVWDSSAPDILDKKGTVYRGGLTEETEVTLTVRITLGEERYEEQFEILVPPFLPDEEENRLYQAECYLKGLEEESRGEAFFSVPMEYEGIRITDKPSEKKGMLLLPVIIFMIPVLVILAKRQEKEKQKKQRENELLAGYPQFVTKLTLYVGAGLSLRSAWERLAAEYRERSFSSGKREELYEEILVLAGELKNGVPEAKAYETFGKRLALRPYLRCTALLIGQLEKGAGGLREKLDLEVRTAWDNHRLQAEARGEEAQTKLLFPMMGMLFLVFAIVMIPAFFQMGM